MFFSGKCLYNLAKTVKLLVSVEEGIRILVV